MFCQLATTNKISLLANKPQSTRLKV